MTVFYSAPRAIEKICYSTFSNWWFSWPTYEALFLRGVAYVCQTMSEFIKNRHVADKFPWHGVQAEVISYFFIKQIWNIMHCSFKHLFFF